MSWAWDTSPELLCVVLGLALLYRLAVSRMRPAEEPFPSRRALWFDGGLLVFYLSVGSPLDTMGEEYLFTAHMMQHCILIFVLPIMVLKGIPSWMVDPLFSRRWPRLLGRFLANPIIAVVAFNVTFAAWHIPGLYEWALRDPRIHQLEHATFVLAGLWMWWPIMSPSKELPPLGDGGQILYVFALSVTQLPLFAWLCFTSHVIYPTYEAAPRLHHLLPPLEDQILGGAIMKIFGEVFFIGVIIIALMRWYQRESRPTPPVRRSKAVATS